MKIVMLTGAGISAESGIETFRDIKNGLWYNYNVDEVASIEGWKHNPKKVLEFHNMLREKCKDKKPNDAHIALVKLEEDHEVTIVTQNVDNLHEKAGSTNVLHIHGELFKSRNSKDELLDCPDKLNLGDMDADGKQIRPHTVLFGELPWNIDNSIEAISEADILMVIGTSFSITYIDTLVSYVNDNCKVYYIDPEPDKAIYYIGLSNLKVIMEKATIGVNLVVNSILC